MVAGEDEYHPISKSNFTLGSFLKSYLPKVSGAQGTGMGGAPVACINQTSILMVDIQTKISIGRQQSVRGWGHPIKKLQAVGPGHRKSSSLYCPRCICILFCLWNTYRPEDVKKKTHNHTRILVLCVSRKWDGMPKSEIDISKYLWQVQVTKLGVSFGHVLHFPIERVTRNTLVTDFITSLKDTRAQTDAGDCEVWRNTLAHASLYTCVAWKTGAISFSPLVKKARSPIHYPVIIFWRWYVYHLVFILFLFCKNPNNKLRERNSGCLSQRWTLWPIIYSSCPQFPLSPEVMFSRGILNLQKRVCFI